MMKLFYSTLILVVFINPFCPAQAQIDINADNEAVGGIPLQQFVFQEFRNKLNKQDNSKVEGSPFTSEIFQKTGIYSKDGLEGYVYSRYDGFNEEVQLKKTLADSNISKLIQREDISCEVDGLTIVYRKYFDKKNKFQNGHLFKVFESEDITIFERKLIRFKDGKIAANPMQMDVPDKFVPDSELYYMSEDGSVRYLKISKKNILNLFENTGKANEIIDFAKKKNINLKSIRGAMEILSYYKSL